MSAIIFHAKSQGTANLAGAERHYMMSQMRKYGYEMNLNYAAVNINSDISLLNACLATGSDTLILLMRIHAQCESHCWVDGPNREWMANIIAKGRADGLYRFNMGWGEVEAFLRKSDAEPVFLSYSISSSFPSAVAAQDLRIHLQRDSYFSYRPEKSIDSSLHEVAEVSYIPGNWDDLSTGQQWDLHEQVLRQQSKLEDAAAHNPEILAPFSLELRPSNWKDYFFEYPTIL